MHLAMAVLLMLHTPSLADVLKSGQPPAFLHTLGERMPVRRYHGGVGQSWSPVPGSSVAGARGARVSVTPAEWWESLSEACFPEALGPG